MKTIGVIVIAMIALLALTGSVMADARVNATPEVQGISTTTFIEALGAVSTDESIAWTITNQEGITTYPLLAGEIMYQAGYSDVLKADAGYTVFNKQSKVSTANQLLGSDNIDMQGTVKYDAGDTVGTLTKTESITIDGSGNVTDTASGFMCVFAAANSGTVPKYCNFATAGSKISGVTLTSTETTAQTSFIGASWDYPVTLDYSIAAEGIGTFPMEGTAAANSKIWIKEARNGTAQAEDLLYTDTGTASGTINKFSKTYAYQSGFRLLA